jgi:hypothetical protein
MMAGGHSEASSDIGEKIIEICGGLKDQIIAASEAGEATTFDVVSVRQQVVAGMIYHVKVHLGNEEHVHAKIFAPLPHTGNPAELQAAKGGFSRDAALELL